MFLSFALFTEWPEDRCRSRWARRCRLTRPREFHEPELWYFSARLCLLQGKMATSANLGNSPQSFHKNCAEQYQNAGSPASGDAAILRKTSTRTAKTNIKIPTIPTKLYEHFCKIPTRIPDKYQNPQELAREIPYGRQEEVADERRAARPDAWGIPRVLFKLHC